MYRSVQAGRLLSAAAAQPAGRDQDDGRRHSTVSLEHNQRFFNLTLSVPPLKDHQVLKAVERLQVALCGRSDRPPEGRLYGDSDPAIGDGLRSR